MITPERIMSWAIPGFFVLIGVELLVATWRGRHVYDSNDAINSLGLGMISQIVGVFTKLFAIGIYGWCAAHLALWRLPVDSVWVWISGLLLYDLLYYWLHRLGHEVNVLWAAHVVHHQSERYNLTTALRQTGSGFLLGWLFYLPMALLGYPVEVFAVVALIDLLYQFWVHTEVIDRLGWFDRVFCSPSNHRAHHAVNDRYLDRNYGGILIIWDRLFGSFVEENDDDPPIYGTRAPLQSWNPLWANVEVYWAMLKDSWHARNWVDKLRVWIKPPGWRPADVAARFPKVAFDMTHARYNPPISAALKLYCLAAFGVLLLIGVHFLDVAPKLELTQATLYALYLVYSLCAIGFLLESRGVGLWLEWLRTTGTAVFIWMTGHWFGVAQLDPRIAVAMIALFGLSAVAVLGLSGYGRRIAGTARPAMK
ncbi:sterol desaturase family protein [Dyella caseinilytica]|uniref:Sterol desaturase family protein n=1 Tax=Dyella caseinilytica TaxID=1849581 RepID=A0ABX7GSM9_9GAMM|nr:sterol desaturase family protein [Dyella caseinilytica]QRN53441.1 sterol desaturase family protein [Dyella caseinilytica]GFZ86546.1 sterol desaturase [Dyella caseinilytica]